MAETVSQTWKRVTGQEWGNAANPYTDRSYNGNIALQKRLNTGWNPFAAPAPVAAPASPTPNAAAAPPSPAVNPVDYFNNASKAVDDKLASNRTDLTNLYSSQDAELKAGVDKANETYGIADKANTVNTLKTRVMDLQTNASGRLDGSGSAAQIDRYLNSKILPRYQDAQGNLQSAEQLKSTDIGFLVEKQTRQATGFTSLMENELSALITKMTTGTQLTQQEAQRFQDLALKEKEFATNLQISLANNATSLKAAQIGADASVKSAGISAGASRANSAAANRYISMGNGQLYDTQTGKIIGGITPSTGSGSNSGKVDVNDPNLWKP